MGAFEEEWPELARRLACALRRRNVAPWLVDDIVQETGLRLYRMWHDVDPERSVWGLVLTIAKNLLWDEMHRRSARELLIEVPERPNDHDVERAGIARLELWRVSRALDQLSPAHRSVLLAEVDGEARRAEVSRAATKMMRMRARRRLSALLENASASCLAVGVATRRWALNMQQFFRRNSTVLETPAPMAVAAVLGAVVVMIIPTTALPSPSAERSVVDAATVTVDGLGSVHDGWESGLDARRTREDGGSTGSARGGTGRAEADSYGFAIGGGGAEAEARVEVREKRRRKLKVVLPECGVDATSEPNAVTVRCRVETRDETYDIEATVRAPAP
ncbi:MAG: hypothetical protein M3161_03090 [Actinomycetota bacterium]|nr:hypothetical protein [Actinomycetota bacterium]